MYTCKEHEQMCVVFTGRILNLKIQVDFYVLKKVAMATKTVKMFVCVNSLPFTSKCGKKPFITCECIAGLFAKVAERCVFVNRFIEHGVTFLVSCMQ